PVIRKKGDRFITRGDSSSQADGAIRGGQIVGRITAKECAPTGRIVMLEGRGARLRFFAAGSRWRISRMVRNWSSPGLKQSVLLTLWLLLTPTFLRGQVAVDLTTFTLTSVANASGGNTVYTGTITGGATNAFIGDVFTIAGFTTAANNGTFTCTASTATTLTLSNISGVAETHAATATGSTASSATASPNGSPG